MNIPITVATQKEKVVHGENHNAGFGCQQLLHDNTGKLIAHHNHQVRQDCIPEAQA